MDREITSAALQRLLGINKSGGARDREARQAASRRYPAGK
jgi:hypothetical protein